jgi:hypothetical protein
VIEIVKTPCHLASIYSILALLSVKHKEVEFTMEENDFKRIEQLVSNVVDAKLGQQRKEVNEDFQRHVDAKFGQHRKEVNEDFKRHVGILSEDFQHKLQLVAEGQQMLAEKMGRMQKDIEEVDRKLDAGTAGLAGSMRQLDKKLDAVTVELAAHRTDTEGHKRGYIVSEP